MTKHRILVVEDEGIIAADLADRLEQMGYEVVDTAATAEQALARATAHKPDLVLMDIVLKGPTTGIDAAKRIKLQHDIPIVFVSSHADEATLHRAVGARPFGYVLKPFNERELQAAIEIALFRHGAEGKLGAMERWLAGALEGGADAVMATDAAGVLTRLNAPAEALTGWPQGDAVGRPLHDVLALADAQGGWPVTDLVEGALREGVTLTLGGALRLRPREGAEQRIDCCAAALRDALGDATGAVLCVRPAVLPADGAA